MKFNRWMLVSLVFVLSLFAATAAQAMDEMDIARLKGATGKFHSTEAAKKAGWDLVTGLDYCFNKPGSGAMGYHYINVNLLDLTINELEPEAMVYAPGEDGKLQLAAIEYIVPAAAWDAAGNSQPPSALGHSFHLNQALGVYVLHAWIWRTNPAGMLEDWNPQVSCQ